MEKDKNTSRASQTRSKSERPKVWVPPSSLDAPPAPDGFRYRWIRAESVGFQDTKNITGRIREGYELVRAEEVQNDLMKEQDQRMPINVERQSRVTFGGTKK
jgi:hypothetical protein